MLLSLSGLQKPVFADSPGKTYLEIKDVGIPLPLLLTETLDFV